uniref:ST3 beta-galactoside alpha-2,3-sialyltransferase 4 n=1 Tax=Canis lupus dingo TaxID=286419 RepID=A0A8C0QYY3_CANLU
MGIFLLPSSVCRALLSLLSHQSPGLRSQQDRKQDCLEMLVHGDQGRGGQGRSPEPGPRQTQGGSSVQLEQGSRLGLITLFPRQSQVSPLRGGGQWASAAQQLAGRCHQQVRRGHQVCRPGPRPFRWGVTVDGPVGLWVTGIPSPPPRLNNAPVAGYEGDVGSKTTMRLFYPESAHFNPKVENNPDTLLVLVAFKAMDFHWIETILSDKKRVRKGFWKQPPLIWDVNPRQVRILNPFFMEIAADKLLNLPMKQPRKIKQKPTTGLLAITLALHLCDLVHIAGFGYPDAHNRKQTIHYYEQITLKSMAGSGHNVSQEALAIKRMLEIGAVKNLTFF